MIFVVCRGHILYKFLEYNIGRFKRVLLKKAQVFWDVTLCYGASSSQ